MGHLADKFLINNLEHKMFFAFFNFQLLCKFENDSK